MTNKSILRAAAKPTRWLWPASIAVQAISVVVSILLLGNQLWPFAFLGSGLGLLLLAYLPYFVARRDLGQQGRFPSEAAHADHVALHRIRKISLWLAFFLLLRLPFYLCFLLNLQALDKTAHRIDTGGVQGEINHIGFFPIRRRLIGHGGAEFETPGGRTLLYRPAWLRGYYDPQIRPVIGHWFVSDEPINPAHSFGQHIERHFW